MPRLSAVLLLLAGACDQGSGDDVAADAPKATVDALVATSCGSDIPTTASATLNITGNLNDGTPGMGGVADATVTANGGGSTRGTATSEISGLFMVAATTGGLPIDFLTFAGTGSKSARYFPRQPIAKSISLASLPLFSTADAATYFGMFGVTQSPSNGAAIIIVNDCADAFTENATVTVTPPGTAVVKYLHEDGSTTGTSTDASGVAVILNITPGTVTINALVGSQTYHAHDVTADASYVTLAAISEQ